MILSWSRCLKGKKVSETNVRFEAKMENGQTADITVHTRGRSFEMLGPAGAAREEAAVGDLQGRLPVLLGLGMGHALLKTLAATTGHVAVVEKYPDIEAISPALSRVAPDDLERLFFVREENPHEALALLTHWQDEHGGKPLTPVILPFYQRLDRPFFGQLREFISASASFDFWSKARIPRFRNPETRILLLTSKYFLMGELERACQKLRLPYKLVVVGEGEVGREDFTSDFLRAVLEFQPDFCLTLNHLGVDVEGVLMDLLARLELPLASWFVDNPHLIVHQYEKCVSPWTALFSYDEDTVPSLKEAGFVNVRYLPLGTDVERFRPDNVPVPASWKADVSFVGNSMIEKVAARLKKGGLPRELLSKFNRAAQAYEKSSTRSVSECLKVEEPEIYGLYQSLSDREKQLAFETAVTWQATRLYRNGLARRLLPFHPLIVGDTGWLSEFRKERASFRFMDAISYYSQLPQFYQNSKINFNCTSKQMKGAVNQRVFDVPASGSFVLTDWRPQMDALFEADEMACYHAPEEIPALVEKFLNYPEERKKIVRNARKRVLAEHKWEDRLKTLVESMRDFYGKK